MADDIYASLYEEQKLRALTGESLTVTGLDHVTMSCYCEKCKQRRHIVELVLAERERCARHADDAASNAGEFGSPATAIICEAIASRIREGQP